MKTLCEFCGKREGERKYSSLFLICKRCWFDGHKCPECGKGGNRSKIFCSRSCWYGNKRFVKNASKNMTRNNLKRSSEISERMRLENPTHMKGVVAKIRKTKNKNGTLHASPTNRGGNGFYTKHQTKLNSTLGWEMEFPIKTAPDSIKKGHKRKFSYDLGLPTTYKVDIGNSVTKLAVEIDGKSHYGKRKCLDLKKETYIKSLGWTVLRFTNKEVTKNFSLVLFRILKKNRILLRSMI